MSYIDRENATDYFMKLATAGKLTDDKYAEGLTYAFLTAAHYAQNLAPDADVEPIRHGEWIMKPDPYGFFEEIPVCSACGCTTKLRETYNYCPNCGTRMDKGEADT